MKKLTTLFALFVSFFAIYSCNKGPWHRTISSDVLANFNYQKGTYWIYKDSLTGYIDSMYVSEGGSLISVEGNGIYEDYINKAIVDTNIYPGNIKHSIYFYGWGLQLYSNTIMPFGNYYHYADIQFPWVMGFRAASEPDSAIVSNIYNSFTIAGNNFNNVVEWDNGNDSYPGYKSYRDIIYVCPSAYIVKMRLNHPSDSVNIVWELQRWHIVK